MGVKVRDFAYERTLPPLSSWIPKQKQPTADYFSSAITRPKSNPPQPSFNQPDPTTPPAVTPFGDLQSPKPSDSERSSAMLHQSLEPYITTPVVTPGGTLHWDDSPPAFVGLMLPSTPALPSSVVPISLPNKLKRKRPCDTEPHVSTKRMHH
ncbi:hypothetical protein ONZ45_g13985 [Pleurotus djamor]|nr:hypothetical protein ONZ45_g13985 [Pleurotus djamor]